MSSYAELSLGTLTLAASRNGIDPYLIWLFRESDKRSWKADRRSRQLLAKYIIDDYIDEFDEDNPFEGLEYSCSAAIAKDRLELKGFTYSIAVASFESGLLRNIQELVEFRKMAETLAIGSISNADQLDFLRKLTIESWLDALRRINLEALSVDKLSALSPEDEQLPLLRFMLSDHDGLYGFQGLHFMLFLRLVLELVVSEEQLVYDLTDILSSGYIELSDDHVTLAENVQYSDLHLAQKVIVLTEGESDRRFLERSLKLLHPHLSDYFHFFQFTQYKVGGGAGELAGLVRAFAAAGVRHRIIALFDNDTAAIAALSNLDLTSIPTNIAVRHYPRLALADDYPTLGPTGMAHMDINGLAGSLELYLGRDVLADAEGVLSPVQWFGFDEKIRAYQGSVLNKSAIQRRFEQKLDLCEARVESISSLDWDGLKGIFEVLFTAFHEIDAQAGLGMAV